MPARAGQDDVPRLRPGEPSQAREHQADRHLHEAHADRPGVGVLPGAPASGTRRWSRRGSSATGASRTCSCSLPSTRVMQLRGARRRQRSAAAELSARKLDHVVRITALTRGQCRHRLRRESARFRSPPDDIRGAHRFGGYLETQRRSRRPPSYQAQLALGLPIDPQPNKNEG